MGTSELRRILIRTPGPLGDTVMAEPAIRAIVRRHPEARLTLLMLPPLVPLGRCWNLAEEVIPVERGGWRAMVSALRLGTRRVLAGGFDACIVFSNSFGAALVARAAGPRRIIGYDTHGRGFLLSEPVPRTRPWAHHHVVQHYWRLAERLGVPALPPAPPDEPVRLWLAADPATRPALKPTAPLVTAARAALQRKGLDPDRPFLAVAPGADYGPAKMWPTASYAALCRALAMPVAVLGSPRERPIADGLAALLDARDVANLAGETSIGTLVGVLSLAAAFVGNDSGPAHVAGALGLPGVALFGSTSETHSGPVSASLAVQSLALACAPCFGRTCHRGDYACLRDLAPERAAEAIARALHPQPGAAGRLALPA